MKLEISKRLWEELKREYEEGDVGSLESVLDEFFENVKIVKR